MINVFTRKLNGALASLVKQIDATVAENKSQKLSAFVVLLADDPDTAAGEIKAFAKKHGLKTPLTIFDGVSGPGKYKIAKDADVTVHLWKRQRVVVNHAFAEGKLDDKAIKQIVKDTAKILN